MNSPNPPSPLLEPGAARCIHLCGVALSLLDAGVEGALASTIAELLESPQAELTAAAPPPELGGLRAVAEHDGRVLAHIRVAGRAGGYGEADQELLSFLARLLGWLLQSRAEERAARAEHERQRQRVLQQMQILDHLQESVITMDLAGFITGWNAGAERLFGYTADEAVGRNVLFLYADPDADEPGLEDLFLEQGGRDMEVRRRRKNGETFWAALQLSVMRDVDGQPSGLIGYLVDITERRSAADSLRLYHRIFDLSADGILVTDAEQRIIAVNQAFSRITGYAADEAVGREPRRLITETQDEAYYAAIRRQLDADGHWHGEIWDRRKDGTLYPKWNSIGVVRDAGGAVSNYFCIFSDITERKEAEGRIHHLAYYDALTGLPNRSLFNRLLEQGLAESRRAHRHGAVLFVDLNRFKPINDTLGHNVGDLVLREVARRLRDGLRDVDVVARLGGDEFVIAVFGDDLREHSARIAERLLDALDLPLPVEGMELKVGAAVGISLFPDDATDPESLLRLSDIAMYRAKETGGDAFTFYSEDLDQRAKDRLALEAALRRGLEQGELLLHYQPKVALGDNRITGAEALVRWRHPERGMVSPGEFIPVAEETGFITRITAWVLEEVCRQASRWRDAGMAPLPLAVNLSARDFSPDLPRRIAELLERNGIGAEWLELEITESMLMNHTDKVIRMMDELAAMGIALALDDFGTGYSSLSYLKRFPIRTLKIDRSFIVNIPRDSSDCAIAGAIVGMSKQLRHKVVAEGVESPEQLEFLHGLGCDEIQGYLYSAPLPAERFAALCGERRPLVSRAPSR